jgi:hypothetical protein
MDKSSKKPDNNLSDFQNQEEKAKIDQEIKAQRKQTKQMQIQLLSEGGLKGKKSRRDLKQGRQIHLDVYTSELRTLIGKLNDDNLDAVQANSKSKIKRNQTQVVEQANGGNGGGQDFDGSIGDSESLSQSKPKTDSEHLKEKL